MIKKDKQEPIYTCQKCGKKCSQVRGWYGDEEWKLNGKKIQSICTPCFFERIKIDK